MPGYGEPYRPNRWREMLNTSWPLFRAFGVDVRVSWTIALFPLLLWYVLAKFLDVGPALGWAVAWTVGLYACVWTHEMGHIVAGWRYGVPARAMTLRALGGLAHLDSPAPNPRAEMVIALAGPATHLAWMAVLYPMVWVARAAGADEHSLWMWNLEAFAGLQFSMVLFNLLPFFPLDGGRAFRAFLSTRMHSNRASLWTANVGFAGAVMLGLMGLTTMMPGVDYLGSDHWGFFLVWIAVENWVACRRLQMEARWGEGAYEPTETWKTQGGYDEPWQEGLRKAEKLDREATQQERKAAEARAKAEDTRRKLQERIDELLDRINEVGGIDNLSKAERRELTEASALLNETG